MKKSSSSTNQVAQANIIIKRDCPDAAEPIGMLKLGCASGMRDRAIL